VALQDMV